MNRMRLLFFLLSSFLTLDSFATFVSQRRDVVGGVVLQTNNGTAWGRWGEARFCPEGTYVSGFSLKVEGHQGQSDDTALNNIKLSCSGSYQNSYFEFEADAKTGWGNYGGNSYCPNQTFMKGFSLKVESDRAFGDDDTAVNDMKAFCGHQFVEVQSSNGQKFGRFGSQAYCPGQSSVCGLSVKSEEPQGMADDTAVNDVTMYCCYDY